jgi:hypothetical protein
MIWLTYAYRIFYNLSVGCNMKLLQPSVDAISGMGLSGDLGIIFNPLTDLRLSFVAQDFLSKMKWDTNTSESFIRVNRFGVAYHFRKMMLISGDVIRTGKEMKWAVASEIKLLNLLKLRSGWREKGWTLGTGLSLPILNQNIITVNYTIISDPFQVEMYHIFDFSFQMTS